MAKKSRRRSNRPDNAPANRGTQDTTSGRADSRRAQRIVQQQQAKRRKIYTMFGGAAAAALILVVILILINQDDSGSASDEPVSIPASISAGIQSDGRLLGDAGAPVEIVEYGDYQCPSCGQFARTLQSQMLQDYVTTGKANFEYRDFAFLGDESAHAAEASICAMDQGRFWDFHETLFHNQVGENEGAFDKSRLLDMAGQLDMDVDAFETCIDGDEHEAEVAAQQLEGQQRGVSATPTFYINGIQMVGVADYGSLRDEIEAALQAAQQ